MSWFDWLLALLVSKIGFSLFFSIAIIVFLLLAGIGGATEAWWILGGIALMFIAIYIHADYKASKEIKRLKGEDDEDSNEHLVLYMVIGIAILVGIALTCYFLSRPEEPKYPRRPLTTEEIRRRDSLREESRKEQLRWDSIYRAKEKARKLEHEEYIRKMARDIVNSGKKDTRKSDNMRGWDPASEDDLKDNGMDRYMENDDERGWD